MYWAYQLFSHPMLHYAFVCIQCLILLTPLFIIRAIRICTSLSCLNNRLFVLIPVLVVSIYFACSISTILSVIIIRSEVITLFLMWFNNIQHNNMFSIPVIIKLCFDNAVI